MGMAFRYSALNTRLLLQQLVRPCTSVRCPRMVSYRQPTVTLLCPLTSLMDQRRQAGHSKWQNIRHIKGAKDAVRARVNSRTVQDIEVAIRDGKSADPKFNFLLARVIERAEKQDVPRLVITNALKRAKEGKPRVSHVYDAKGPGNCAILIEALTEHVTKTKNELSSVLKKHASRMGDGKSALFAYEKKGYLYLATEGMSLEAAEDVAIETGAEEVEEDEDEDGNAVYKFICAEDDLFTVKKQMESKELSINRHGHEYVANTLQTVSSEAQEMFVKLLDRLEAMDEVVRVYDNIQLPE